MKWNKGFVRGVCVLIIVIVRYLAGGGLAWCGVGEGGWEGKMGRKEGRRESLK